MKTMVNEDVVKTRAELWQKILDDTSMLRNEQLFFKIKRFSSRRTMKCIELEKNPLPTLIKKNRFIINLFISWHQKKLLNYFI